VKLPKSFTLWGPGPGYTCGPPKMVPSTKFLTPDGLRRTQALCKFSFSHYSIAVFWNAGSRLLTSILVFMQWLGMLPALTHNSWQEKTQVAVYLFHLSTIRYSLPAQLVRAVAKTMTLVSSKPPFPLPQTLMSPRLVIFTGETKSRNVLCWRSGDSRILQLPVGNTTRKDNSSLLQCTHHMCPVRVHWHVKVNYKEYWRVKIAITNFNYMKNYSTWTLVVQHPNLNNVTQVFSFEYKPLIAYDSISEYQEILQFYHDEIASETNFDLTFLLCDMQMTQGCSMAWRTTMTY
jgi:hypothetical protein